MITYEDITRESQLQLIELLIEDLKSGILNQRYLLTNLIPAGLLGDDAEKIMQLIQSLVQHCEAGAQNNDALSLFTLGFIHHKGLNGSINFEKAIEYYERAIKLQHPEAMFNRGRMYACGEGSQENPKLANQLYRDAMDRNSDNAMLYLAEEMFNRGEIAKAIELLELAKKYNNDAAIHILAEIRLDKDYGKPDIPQAIELLESAIQLASPPAMLKRAEMLVDENYGKPDRLRAIELLKSAIKLGCLPAVDELSNMLNIEWPHLPQYSDYDLDDPFTTPPSVAFPAKATASASIAPSVSFYQPPPSLNSSITKIAELFQFQEHGVSDCTILRSTRYALVIQAPDEESAKIIVGIMKAKLKPKYPHHIKNSNNQIEIESFALDSLNQLLEQDNQLKP